jgi:NAD-dependent dihydropyrimidine dehydrogenase PreA subunit
MTVGFNKKKCSMCGLCVSTCPPRAMEIHTVGSAIPR